MSRNDTYQALRGLEFDIAKYTTDKLLVIENAEKLRKEAQDIKEKAKALELEASELYEQAKKLESEAGRLDGEAVVIESKIYESSSRQKAILNNIRNENNL